MARCRTGSPAAFRHSACRSDWKRFFASKRRREALMHHGRPGIVNTEPWPRQRFGRPGEARAARSHPSTSLRCSRPAGSGSAGMAEAITSLSRARSGLSVRGPSLTKNSASMPVSASLPPRGNWRLPPLACSHEPMAFTGPVCKSRRPHSSLDRRPPTMPPSTGQGRRGRGVAEAENHPENAGTLFRSPGPLSELRPDRRYGQVLTHPGSAVG